MKSITVSTGTLTPEFDPEVYSYTVSVDESVNDITLTAESYHASCTINNTGNHTLTAGANTIVLEAVAERGEIRPYTASSIEVKNRPTKILQAKIRPMKIRPVKILLNRIRLFRPFPTIT